MKEPKIPKSHPLLTYSHNVMLADMRSYLAKVKRAARRKEYPKGVEK